MFIDNSINQKSLLEFVKKFKKIGQLQQIAIVEDNKEVLNFAVEPHNTSQIKQLFSLSKTFTSMAIGMAVEEGLLKLDDKIIDFFPTLLPKEVSPYLAKMEVKHLLTMSSGHKECTMPYIYLADNPVQAFLALELTYEPGTTFVYNTGASFILSAIISVVTKKSVEQYLQPLFEALDITDHYSDKIGNISLGGTGLHVNINAIKNFGIMLLNEGKFNGKQVVSKEYVKLATSKQIDNYNATIDWIQGYGYHLWMSRGGFRCDGAYGQLCLVYPERKLVIAVQAYVEDMQKEVDLVNELMNDLYSDDVVENIENEINNVYKVEKTNEIDFDKINLCLEHNKLDITHVIIEKKNDKIELKFVGENSFVIEAGNGYYIKNIFDAKGIKRKLSQLMPAVYEQSIASCYYKYESNKLEIILINHNTPLWQSFVFDFENKNAFINEHNIKFK